MRDTLIVFFSLVYKKNHLQGYEGYYSRNKKNDRRVKTPPSREMFNWKKEETTKKNSSLAMYTRVIINTRTAAL